MPSVAEVYRSLPRLIDRAMKKRCAEAIQNLKGELIDSMKAAAKSTESLPMSFTATHGVPSSDLEFMQATYTSQKMRELFGFDYDDNVEVDCDVGMRRMEAFLCSVGMITVTLTPDRKQHRVPEDEAQ